MSGLRRLGGNVGRELEGDQRDAAPLTPEKGIYDTPAKNMKATGVAMEELLYLDGDAFERQRQRCKTLVGVANKQQLELDPDGVVSLMVSDTKSHGSSHPSRLEKAGAAKGGRGDDGAQSANNGGNRKTRRAASRASKEPAASKAPVSERLGSRVLAEGDARHRVDLLTKTRAREEEGLAGPMCFGSRIRDENFPEKFVMPCDIQKYDGTTKPEDWLVDYSTAINIAGGNLRLAVRYVPLVLKGTARTWLNSLPKGSINTWLEFERAFVRNFSTTYQRPGRSRQLQSCVQAPNESTRS
jgi:hypothetical protein